MNRTVFTLEKQQGLIKSNLDIITRKVDRSNEEVKFLLDYVKENGFDSGALGKSLRNNNYESLVMSH